MGGCRDTQRASLVAAVSWVSCWDRRPTRWARSSTREPSLSTLSLSGPSMASWLPGLPACCCQLTLLLLLAPKLPRTVPRHSLAWSCLRRKHDAGELDSNWACCSELENRHSHTLPRKRGLLRPEKVPQACKTPFLSRGHPKEAIWHPVICCSKCTTAGPLEKNKARQHQLGHCL